MFITLPTPLTGGSTAPGQLITDPLNGQAILSCLPSPTRHQLGIYSTQHTGIAYDAHDRHDSSKYSSSQSQRKDSVILSAEESFQTSLV